MMINEIMYTSPGLYSWTCPPNIYEVYIIAIGGGGGGAGVPNNSGSVNYMCGGGGGGGFGIGRYSVVPYTTYPIIVGSGGLGGGINTPSSIAWPDNTIIGNGNSSGSNGGTSSFSNFITATGGYGGKLFSGSNSYVGAKGGTVYGANIFNYDGGLGGGINISNNCTVSPFTTGGISTGGGGLCGSNGGNFTVTTTSIYQGATASLAGITTGGGGIYPNAIANSSSSYHVGGGCGINQPSAQLADYALTEYSSTLFSGNSIFNQIPIDIDIGGCPNKIYRNDNMPAHLDTVFKLFKIVAGSSNSFAPYTSLSLGLNTLPCITGGTASINNDTRAQGALLIGGSSGGESSAVSLPNNFDSTKAGFGCGGGGNSINNSTYKIGCKGGGGLVYFKYY